MIRLTEAGKAHVIKSLDIKFEANHHILESDLPKHKENVYTAWFKHCETKLNMRRSNTIPVGLGWLTFEERMVQNVS
jgi:hypothetical protein